MANINTELEQIRKAVYGREVRGSIANAIELINKEQVNTSNAQTNLNNKFEQLIINAGNSNAEVVAARVKADGTQFNTLGKRLDKSDEVHNTLNNEVINARIDSKNVTHKNLKARMDNFDSQLEYKAIEQEDYIETLKRHMNYKDEFSVICNQVKPYPNLTITYETLDGKGVSYSLSSQKDIDQFLMLGLCRYGNLSIKHNFSLTKNFYKTGVWNETGTYYTTEVGATMKLSFFGSKLVFKHFSDTRGGVWEFVIDGDSDNKITISTYGTENSIKYTTVFEDTKNVNHVVVATFKGDDPLNPPSSSPSRGWCGTVGGTTFDIYKAIKTNTSIVEPLSTASNKEFAFKIKKNGTNNPTYFVPYHGTETAFKINDPTFIINGIEVALKDNDIGNMWSDVKDFKVIQSLYARVPETPENLLKINCIHSFKNDGTVNIDLKTEALTDTFIESGYGMMFPVWTGFSNIILTGFNNKYETIKTDYSVTYLEKENDKCNSFISLNNSTFKDMFMCVTVNNPKLSLRQNEIDKETRKEYMTWIEHRDSTLQKLYPQVFKNTVFKAGDTYRNSMTFYFAYVEGFRNLL